MALRSAGPAEVGAACLLACLAGAVDAVGFLHLGGLFVSFMSGNTTRFGVFLAGPDMWSAGKAIGIIGAFVAGAAVGSTVGALSGRWRRAAVLFLEAAALAGAAAASRSGVDPAGTALMAAAMGAENAVFVDDKGETRINLTFMTGALIKIGEGLARAALGGPRWDWCPFLLLWLSLAAGAFAGAASFVPFGLESLDAIALTLLVIAGVFAVADRRQTAMHSPRN